MKKIKQKNRTQLLNWKIITVIILSISILPTTVKTAPENEFIVPLCRQFSKDLFDLNANPYLSPTVQVVNATSNAGFFHSAYVPRKVNKPYFRLSGNFMLGTVRNDMKTFNPQIPSKKYNQNDLGRFVEIIPFPLNINIKDTAGLINYFLQNLLYQGIYEDKTLTVPKHSPTTLGSSELVYFYLPNDVMQELFKNHPLYKDLSSIPGGKELLGEIEEVLRSFPIALAMPEGGNIDKIMAAVPQFEIGSLYGTELLIRFIPPLDYGDWIGKFSFWGIGLKHSISQYFYNDTNRDGNANKREQIAPFDLAVQMVFQRTGLENTVGITDSKLKTDANIFNFNLHASKNFNNYFEVHTGLSFERTKINGTYTYYLPIDLQRKIGLLDATQNPDGSWSEPFVNPPEYPGDDVPQSSDVAVSSNHIKWVIGASKNIGPVTVFMNYNVSKFNIFSGGIQYRF